MSTFYLIEALLLAAISVLQWGAVSSPSVISQCDLPDVEQTNCTRKEREPILHKNLKTSPWKCHITTITPRQSVTTTTPRVLQKSGFFWKHLPPHLLQNDHHLSSNPPCCEFCISVKLKKCIHPPSTPEIKAFFCKKPRILNAAWML